MLWSPVNKVHGFSPTKVIPITGACLFKMKTNIPVHLCLTHALKTEHNWGALYQFYKYGC